MFLRNTQLLLRTEHRVAHHPAHRATLERRDHPALGVAVVDPRTLFGVHRLERVRQRANAAIREQVWRARHHRMWLRGPVIHISQHQPLSVRVRLHLQNIADQDLLRVPGQRAALQPNRADIHHFHAAERKLTGQLLHRHSDLDKLPQPAQRDFHL